MSQHWTDDRLIERLYGTVEEDRHLEVCPECQTRLQQMQQRRSDAVFLAAPPAEFFHRQRSRVQARLSSPMYAAVWVPATLAVALVAGLLITRTSPRPTPQPQAEAAIIEAGWFEDHYSATRELEPRAASPIRQLFAEGPVLE